MTDRGEAARPVGRLRGAAWGAATLTMAMAAPGVSLAGLVAECLWRTVPIATQDRIFAEYEAGGHAAAVRTPPNPDPDIAIACMGRYPQTEAEATAVARRMGRILGATSRERASASFLAARGFGQARLDAGWNSIGATKRDLVRSSIRALMEGGPYDKAAFVDATVAAAQAAGWDWSDAMKMPFLDYFTYRAAREAWEAS